MNLIATSLPIGLQRFSPPQIVEQNKTNIKKPYILKTGCTFALHTTKGVSSATAPKGSRSILKQNDIEIVIENCRIVSNDKKIPIYGK